MDSQEFDRLVSEDVKNQISPEKAEYIRLPSNQNAWRGSLLKLIQNLDEQIEGLAKDESTSIQHLPSHLITDFKITADEKRTKVNRFRFYVQQRLAEADRMLALGEDSQDPDLKMADFLRRAIEEHQALMVQYDFEPTPIDQALWQAMDGDWGFVGLKNELENW